MPGFIGANVADITKIKQSDVFLDGVSQKIVGLVNVPQSVIDADEVLPLGTLLRTEDGGATFSPLTVAAYEAGSFSVNDEVYFEGHIYKSTADTNTTPPTTGDWDDLGTWDANGILYNDLSESKKTTVVVTGGVKEKYLKGCDAFLKVSLFKNKILVK